ncbi:MAG: LamG domain-containing protein, partial [Planctomycetales bacterium]
FDVGWVGAVAGKTRVNDGRPHRVAMTYRHKTGTVQLYVDGKLDGQGTLKPGGKIRNSAVRVGFASPDFPKPSFYQGEIAQARFYQQALSAEEIAGLTDKTNATKKDALIALWNLSGAKGTAKDASGNGRDAQIVKGKPRVVTALAATESLSTGALVAGLIHAPQGSEWTATDQGDLRLRIPAGKEPLKFTLWTSRVEKSEQTETLVASLSADRPAADLIPLTQGGPGLWPQTLKTTPILGKSDGSFATDVLTRPAKNPWSARVRLTGFDFYKDGDRMAVCSWDGDVWEVAGLKDPAQGLEWKRIASGLFQPLGLKIVDGDIYLGCRDQITILRDLNDDGETDLYECFNNDHQVTEHFHEFAMGLQRGDDGAFYYAKSAR